MKHFLTLKFFLTFFSISPSKLFSENSLMSHVEAKQEEVEKNSREDGCTGKSIGFKTIQNVPEAKGPDHNLRNGPNDELLL